MLPVILVILETMQAETQGGPSSVTFPAMTFTSPFHPVSATRVMFQLSDGLILKLSMPVVLELPTPSSGSITCTVISPSSGKKLIVPDANGSAIAESLVGISLMGTDSIN
jgi:hypothetical protein